MRVKGAGRPTLEQKDPLVWEALNALMDPVTRGDPMSPLRWTTKLTVKLSEVLALAGHQMCPMTVARLLKDHGYSLQANAKKLEGRQHRGTRRPVYLSGRAGQCVRGRWAAGDFGRHEEEGEHWEVLQWRCGVLTSG